MAVDPTPALNRLVVVLGGLVGMQHVYTGAPESFDSRVNAYVTLGAWTGPDKATQVIDHAIEFNVIFGYRVAGAEATVETDLATMVGRFFSAMIAERTGALNNTCTSVGIPDFSRARDPRYDPVAGQEFRLYPGVVPTVHRETFSLS